MGQYHRIVSLTAREFMSPSSFGDGVKLREFSSSTAGAMFALGQMLLHDWNGHRVLIIGDYSEPTDIPKEALTGFSLGDVCLYEATSKKEDWEAQFNDCKLPNDILPDMNTYLIAITFNDAAEKASEHCLQTGLVKENSKDPDGKAWHYIRIWNLNYKKIGKGTEHHLIVNLSKKEFLSPESFGDYLDANDFTVESNEYGIMATLATLLAVSCKGGSRGGGDFDSTSELVGSWGGDHIAIIPLSELDKTFSDISDKMKKLFEEVYGTREIFSLHK